MNQCNHILHGGVKNFNIPKIFFIIVILCTIIFMSIQIHKNKYEQKYVIMLLILFVLSFIGGSFITKLKGSGPYALYYILKFLFLGGPVITLFVLNILLGQDKF